ncbi:gp058 [Erwinia phage vB_EamP-S6]|uniref:Gp058 n=1 Tax=Erwinia phage vB_EamP-S6 TaxID=1051675 RepID=G0YQF0_9CAUD|nr:gp058 [Erwinia phage vB_EamP-S6]AEJ81577.1 gp058 [Erwinia phage vB_EamP-S6]
MNKNTEGASSPAPADFDSPGYIIVEIDYSKNWLMPLEDGLKLIEALRVAKLYKKDYNDEHPVVSTLPPVSFKFVSEEQYRAWQVQELFTV